MGLTYLEIHFTGN